MKIECLKDQIKLHPETDVEEIYLENVLGLKKVTKEQVNVERKDSQFPELRFYIKLSKKE